jgi:hypothetical protein
MEINKDPAADFFKSVYYTGSGLFCPTLIED